MGQQPKDTLRLLYRRYFLDSIGANIEIMPSNYSNVGSTRGPVVNTVIGRNSFYYRTVILRAVRINEYILYLH